MCEVYFKSLVFFGLIFFTQFSHLFSQNEFISAGCGESRLMEDLLVVNYWDKRLNEKFPIVYDHLLQGGYFSMPSARMGPEGEISMGYAWVPPYYQYNLKLQLVDFLEVSGSYRVFRGIDDPILTPLGFGDYSDKGANIKLSLLRPEDSHYQIPGLAIGLEDFMGTSSFKAYYVVMTQVFLKYHLEVSLGYGARRFKGWFGGLNWMPFRNSPYEFLHNVSFVCEYDAIPYKDKSVEKHPKGRIKRSPLNFGIKYHFMDMFDLSLSYIRGDKLALSVSGAYNFGHTKGIIPKFENKLPYQAPVNIQPIGELRPEDIVMQDLIFAMNDHGLDILESWIGFENNQKVLRIKISNLIYREEQHLKERLVSILACLTPEDIGKVIVSVDAFFVTVQEYHFEIDLLRRYKNKEIGRFEFNLLTPIKEATFPNKCYFRPIFYKKKDSLNFEILPRTQTLFGSSRGKFKYALGLTLAINGFLYDNIFYSIQLGRFFLSDFHQLNNVDRLNPSQLINVRSDVIKYYQQKSIVLDEAYLEKIWNWGKGWYTRISLGYFEIEYAGVSSEWLYYPVNSEWAIGMDFAVLKKRSYHSWGFTNYVRKLDGYTPHWLSFIGSQYFLNIYYDWTCADLELKLSVGKFLADDFGARIEFSRYFPSGLQVGFWYTMTNGNDHINDHIYYDKGVFFSVPLDIFYTKSSRSRWGYGMSAWLRDVGVRASTGSELYSLINQQRQ